MTGTLTSGTATAYGRLERALLERGGVHRDDLRQDSDAQGMARAAGRLVALGKAKWEGDELIAGVSPPAKKMPRKKREPERTPTTAIPEFDCAVWVKGDMTIIGASVDPNGAVTLSVEQAQHVYAQLSRFHHSN